MTAPSGAIPAAEETRFSSSCFVRLISFSRASSCEGPAEGFVVAVGATTLPFAGLLLPPDDFPFDLLFAFGFDLLKSEAAICDGDTLVPFPLALRPPLLPPPPLPPDLEEEEGGEVTLSTAFSRLSRRFSFLWCSWCIACVVLSFPFMVSLCPDSSGLVLMVDDRGNAAGICNRVERSMEWQADVYGLIRDTQAGIGI